MITVYHVAGPTWQPSDDLLSWDRLYEQGRVDDADWRWPDAPLGSTDGEICVFRSLREARQFVADGFATAGSVIAEIELDEGLLRRNDEGYDYVLGCIPAAYITLIHTGLVPA